MTQFMQILDNLVILCPCYIIERICQLNCVHGGVTVSKITAQAYTGGTSKRSSYHRRGRDFSSWPTTSLNLSQGLSTERPQSQESCGEAADIKLGRSRDRLIPVSHQTSRDIKQVGVFGADALDLNTSNASAAFTRV